MMKRFLKLSVVSVLVLSILASISITVFAADKKYAKQTKVNAGEEYLLVSDEGGAAVYTFGVGSGRNKVKMSDGKIVSSTPLSDYAVTMESAGGSSFYLKNANGNYLCFEYISTIVFESELVDGQWQKKEPRPLSSRYGLVESSSKLSTTMSDEDAKSDETTRKVTVTTTSYSPIWSVSGKSAYSFSSFVSIDGDSHKTYLTAETTGLFVGDAKSTFSLYVECKEHTVKFDANGGAGKIEDVIVTDGEPVKEPKEEVKRGGYSFLGWSKDKNSEELFDFSTKITDDLTLYAVWKPYTYYVSFHPNGGKGTMPDQEFKYDEYQRLSLNTFTREDHRFLGWSLTQNGKAALGDGESVENLLTQDGETIKLYAVWEKTKTAESEEDAPKQKTEEPKIAKYLLTVRYVDDRGKDIAYTEEYEFADGEKYSVKAIEIDGYTPVKRLYEGEINGKDVTVNVEYTQAQDTGSVWWTVGVIVISLLCAAGVTILVIRYKNGTLYK